MSVTAESNAVPFLPEAGRSVSEDAGSLIAACGAQALAMARLLWVQEDMGLLGSGRLGHWWQVKREVERRLDLRPRKGTEWAA